MSLFVPSGPDFAARQESASLSLSALGVGIWSIIPM